MNCPKCLKSFYFLKDNSKTFCRCKTCGFEDSFSPPSYKNYHNKRYGYKLIRNKQNDPMLEKIDQTLGVRKSDVVLDYGCGSGDYSNYFFSRCKKIIGLDISVERARSRFPKIDFRTQEVNKKLDFADSTVDMIICVNVIEHVVQYEKLLKEFNRILKSDGLLFITTFDTNFILHFIHNDPTHVFEWDEDGFLKFVGNKFKVIQHFKYGSFFNYRYINGLIVKVLKPELCIFARKR